MYALTEPISELLDQPIPERGVNAMLRCPFHEDDSPSFSIHLESGVWQCFGCGEKGEINGLYRKLGRKISTTVFLYQAKQRASDPIISSVNFAAVANSYIRSRSSGAGKDFIDSFCDERVIGEDTLRKFGIGYDESRDAITMPYTDSDKRVIGIKYRFRDGFKASESGSHYGLFGLTEVIGKDKVIICEGESDTLATHSRHGKDYGVCGTSGASVSESQWLRHGLSLLFARRIYLLYDADEPGDKCAAIAMQVLGVDKCVRLRPTYGKDACDFYRNGHVLEELGLE